MVTGALWESHYDRIKQLIDVNPVKITWNRYPLKDNGRGVMIPDTAAEPERKEAWVRISHEAVKVQEAAAAPAGLSTNLSMFLLALYDVDLQTGDVITAEAGVIQKWKTGVVDELSVEGECYAKQAPLVRADGK
jgi:hypothetical protein